jgi:hypothetical protein
MPMAGRQVVVEAMHFKREGDKVVPTRSNHRRQPAAVDHRGDV